MGAIELYLIGFSACLVLVLVAGVYVLRLLYHTREQLHQAGQRMHQGDLRLARLEQERAVMLAGISHDLRTPLARLRLEVEISVPEDSARQHMALDIAQLDATIDKFLDYARGEHEHIRLKPLRLEPILRQCIESISSSYPEEMQIQVHIAHGLLVWADEIELVRIISNLLENARRYGKAPNCESCHILINASPEGASLICLRISDKGLGVPEEQLERLSEPFFRSDSARTAATGAGLGLSIVKKVVRRMGGEFKLRNLPNHPHPDAGGLEAQVCLRRAPAEALKP